MKRTKLKTDLRVSNCSSAYQFATPSFVIFSILAVIGVCGDAEYPAHLTSSVHLSPKAAMMFSDSGWLFSADKRIAQNTPPREGQEWSAEADLERRTLHFFIDGVQQPHHFRNLPVPLVFAIEVLTKDIPIEITFWGELMKSHVMHQGIGHKLR
ncbi:hypothetical protein BLNAU_11068 [Blattamonas nauphoetae]|uniref:Uncharacterized protein n=1 Tax=Blattamonas nauphoetae TaxID=2049346 RepID=A0ABQ9XSQ8_9EUKA|nr:hypothetical protein BLNAU_11068 [Blattamonas nauphoetae]